MNHIMNYTFLYFDKTLGFSKEYNENRVKYFHGAIVENCGS